jgi:hypothetical protein
MAGFGKGILGVAGGRAPMERTAVQKRRPKIRARANPLPITGLRTVSLLELPVKVYGHTFNLDASAGWRRNE